MRLLDTKSFHVKAENAKFTAAGWLCHQRPPIRKVHVVVWQTTSKNFTEKRAARAARLFYLIKPIKSLIFDVVVAVAVAKS